MRVHLHRPHNWSLFQSWSRFRYNRSTTDASYLSLRHSWRSDVWQTLAMNTISMSDMTINQMNRIQMSIGILLIWITDRSIFTFIAMPLKPNSATVVEGIDDEPLHKEVVVFSFAILSNIAWIWFKDQFVWSRYQQNSLFQGIISLRTVGRHWRRTHHIHGYQWAIVSSFPYLCLI